MVKQLRCMFIHKYYICSSISHCAIFSHQIQPLNRGNNTPNSREENKSNANADQRRKGQNKEREEEEEAIKNRDGQPLRGSDKLGVHNTRYAPRPQRKHSSTRSRSKDPTKNKKSKRPQDMIIIFDDNFPKIIQNKD